jgi:hypothetical protein
MLLAAAAQLIMYREPEGAYETDHSARNEKPGTQRPSISG